MGWLQGRTALVTRADDRHGQLAELVRDRGGFAVEVPVVHIVAQPNEQARLAALPLSQGVTTAAYEWVVCTSPRGVTALLDAHPTLDPRLRLAAVGSATAAAFGECDLVPRQQSAAGLVDSFPAPHGTATVLVVQAGGAAPVLGDGLRAAGWHVEIVAPYRSEPLDGDGSESLPEGDVVLFTSASATLGWVTRFGPSTPAVCAAIGPQTARAAADNGLKVHVVAADHSLVGLISAVDSLPLEASEDQPPNEHVP
jgi:uroporphyrinogen-III synthase